MRGLVLQAAEKAAIVAAAAAKAAKAVRTHTELHVQQACVHVRSLLRLQARTAHPGDSRGFAWKAPHNKDTLHIKHYTIRTLCI